MGKCDLTVHIREVVGSSPSPPIVTSQADGLRRFCFPHDYAIEGYTLAKRP